MMASVTGSPRKSSAAAFKRWRTETQQLVVPNSIPIAFPIYLYFVSLLMCAAALAFCGYFNQGRPNKSVAQPVAGYDLLHHSVGLEFARRFSYNGFMNMRIELLANRSNRCHTQGLEDPIQLFINQVYSAQKMPKFIGFSGLNRSFCFQSALEIVEHG